MQDLGYELRRIPIPRTSVNKGKKGRVPLQKHSDRCGGRASYLGSYENSHWPLTQMRKRQQSASSLQAPGVPLQQLPFSQGCPLQQNSPAAQEPRFSRQKLQVLTPFIGRQI